MNPLKRRTRGVKVANHENRIQTLERRIPEDFPHWYGILLAQHNNVIGPTTVDFGFTISDDCAGDPTECEDRFVTDGDYVLFPLGWVGQFSIYLNMAILGGNANIDDAYTPTIAADDTPSKQIGLFPAVEVWRDNAPFGSTSAFAFQAQGEMLKGQGSFLADRLFWAHHIHHGSGVFDLTRDRFAVKPQFSWGLAGAITVSGIMSIELAPDGERTQTGASF